MQVIAFQFSVAFDVVQFHKLCDIRVAFPTTKADFVSSQVDVSIRKHLFPLHEQLLQRIEIGLLRGINGTVLSIGYSILVAWGKESLQGFTPRETVT